MQTVPGGDPVHHVRLAITTALVVVQLSGVRAADVDAIAGRPFGVGRIRLPLDPTAESLIVETNGYTLSERSGRVYYPVISHRRILGLLRDFVGLPTSAGPASLTVYFLFKGDDPLQLTLRTPQPQTLVVAPRYHPRQFLRMQRAWWQQYAAVSRLQERQGDYPPLVETYLANMLSQRLGLNTPLLDRVGDGRSLQQESLLLVLNVESMRIETFEDTLRGTADTGPADLPVPPVIAWPQSGSPTAPLDVQVEPIALHVPEECFYLRFSSFDNYLWLRRFTEQNGGDTSRLITLRGHDAQLNLRVQDQLGLKESSLAELLGNQLISDVALLGRDTYLREGAAIGILFEARNSLLNGELNKQRRSAVARQQAQGATMTELTIDGHKVSFAATPGNELRSFYVVDDRYHLVTNSLAIVERFLEAGQGKRALGKSTGFRVARSNFPINDRDTLFAYLSPAFFRELVSPQYQIELRRRMRAVTDLEMLSLAKLAAKNERLPDQRIEDLISAGLLPEQFNQRPDHSHVVVNGESASDSLRGARGTFLPIPDVEIQGVTAAEADRYAEIAGFHRRRWPDMDPLVLHVQRTPLEGTDRERIDVRAQMVPFDRKKYGMVTSVIGPPSAERIVQPADDAITAQVVFQGGLLNPDIEPHHLFFGIRDEQLMIELSASPTVRLLQVLRAAPAYFGAWPELGLLDLIPLRQAPVPDGNGLARLPFGLWQMSTPEGFSLVGVDPRVLANVAPQLSVAEDDSQAQIRVHVTDVSQSKIQTWLAALDFERAYQTSIGNTRLMHTIGQQLGVPVDAAQQAAEDVLGVKLICALGGTYQLFDGPDGLRFWGSTHWPSLLENQRDGGQFASPLLAWFRGVDAEVKLLDDRVSATATLEVKSLGNGKPKLPFFDLLRRK
jgi:hypothetical protein